MRFLRSPVFLAAAALGAALGAGLGCSSGGPSGPPKTRPPPLVAVAEVEARDVPVEVRAPVDLRPLAQADVGSKVLGYLDAVLVDRGDRVKKGQVLAIVRPSDLPDQLAAARGVLAQANAARVLARVSADRAAQLQPEGLIAQSDVDRAKASLGQAEAAEDSSRAALAALATRLGETRIESPLDGAVLLRRLDPGALVGPPGGGAIVTVARTDVLRVFISANERDAPAIALGQVAYVEVDAAPGRRFEGKVVRLSPAYDAVTRTLEAEVELDNREGLLRPGMYGRGAIRLAVHPHVPVVPVVAVQISDRRRYVFVIAAGKAQRRVVETGVDGGDWLEITKGLSPGETVVIAGTDGLSDGSPVRISQPGGAASAASAATPPVPAPSASAAAPPRTD
jgi:membrane fusion protein, multidrug efflux system